MKFALRSLILAAGICGVLLLLNFLIFSDPKYQEKACPNVTSVYTYRDARPPPWSHLVDCARVFRGDTNYIRSLSDNEWCRRPDEIYDGDFIGLANDCAALKAGGGFTGRDVTQEERDFPIAFSVLMYENVEQTVRLLSAIYRPQNVYCVHVDGKSSWRIQEAIRQVARCFPNILVPAESVNVKWAEFPLVEAELTCLRLLWRNSTAWKYYINLTGREYPLKTNWELVQILKSYNGANDIDGTLHKRPILWTQFVWRNENWRTSERKPDPPHGFLIAKGSGHIAASRALVEFALLDRRAQDLLTWMQDIRAPDEHFFQTLNHNPHLGIPGAYKGDPDLKYFYTRLKIWQSESEVCHGKWVRYICNLGVGDLPRVQGDPHLFLNKIRLEQDPVAFMCLEQWYHNKTRLDGTYNFNTTFYKELPFVKNHV